MTNQVIFWITLGVGGFFLLIFLKGRKGFVEPTKLNLRKDLKGGKVPVTKAQAASYGMGVGVRSKESEEDLYEAPAKNLNVLFMYNGHSFDAYEVLGAPAGASLGLVEKFYQDCLQRPGQDKAFIEAAMAAIRSMQ